MRNFVLLLLSVLPLLIVLLTIDGEIPDPDRNAHDMWANQLIHKGSLVISENGIFDNWQLYYPNTVPKPLELLFGILRAPGGLLYKSFLTFFTGFFVLVSLWHATGRGKTAIFATVFLGLNPVFIILCLRGNPAIPFLGGMFLLQAKGIKSQNIGAILASLSRPEAFIYTGFHSIKNKKWKLLISLGFIGIIWLVFHKVTCGSFLWAAYEVKYSVAAMNYPTVNYITFLPWTFLRFILILGAPAAAILILSFKKWKLQKPFAANFILLTISLILDSLVLPRYIDQLFLLSIPFVFLQIEKIFHGKTRALILILVISFPSLQWFQTIPEIMDYITLRQVYKTVQVDQNQVIAANELLIPGLCLNNNIYDPINRFISIDKAAWEDATETDLQAFDVTQIIIVPKNMYFPANTKEWINGIQIETIYFE